MNVWTSSFERGSRPVVGSSSSRSDRARQQGSRDRDLLLHPPAHLLDRPADALLPDAQAAEDLDRLPPGVACVLPVETGREQQVLHRAELLEEGGVDADPVDQPLDGHLLADDVVAEDFDPTFVEREEAAHQADEGRLAGPVRTEDPVDAAPLEAEGHVRRSR